MQRERWENAAKRTEKSGRTQAGDTKSHTFGTDTVPGMAEFSVFFVSLQA